MRLVAERRLGIRGTADVRALPQSVIRRSLMVEVGQMQCALNAVCKDTVTHTYVRGNPRQLRQRGASLP